MTYLFLFLIGSIGFAATFLAGFVHVGGGHGHGHAGGHGLGHHHGVPAGGHANFSAHGIKAAAKGWLILSPLDLFGMCLGAGAAGLLFQHTVSGSVLPYVALAGAIVFCFFILKPIARFLERFASVPSEGLEGMVAQAAHAVTGFDSAGKGLVKLTLDGQVVQLLATLDRGECESGVSVRKGDELVVMEVDPKRNTCRVSRELSFSSLSEDRRLS